MIGSGRMTSGLSGFVPVGSSTVRRGRCGGRVCRDRVRMAARQPELSEIVDAGNVGAEVRQVEVVQDGENARVARAPWGDFDPEIAAIMMVYFGQGVVGISRLAMSFYYKDTLGLSPTETAVLTGITAIPWLIKPLYGFLSDTVPLLGFRRRSYLVAGSLVGALSWTVLGTVVSKPWEAATMAMLLSISAAFSDVVADSMVVERARDQDQGVAGRLQSLCWGSAAFGGLLSAYFSGSLLETMSPTSVFRLTAVIPLATLSAAFLVREKRSRGPKMSEVPSRLKLQFFRLWRAFRQRSVWMPALFVFLWQSAPSPDTAFFYFATNELHFQPEFLGRVRLLSSAASLVGVGVYQFLLKDVPIKKVLVWSTLISVPLGLTQLVLVTHMNREFGIPDQLFMLGDSAVLSAIGQVAFMPTLVLAAKICPPGVEGSLFAALMSIYNGSHTLSTELGALMTKLMGVTDTNFDNLAQLILICNLLGLAALPLASLIDAADKQSEDDVQET